MLFIDADALSKLAHWNILAVLPELASTPWSGMATVSSIRFRALKATTVPDGKLFRCPKAAARSVEAIQKMSPLAAPDATLLATFAAVPDIDPGEATLLALVASGPEDRLLTGDKRALRSLARLPEASRWCGRIFTVEQVIACGLKSKGRDWLLQGACPFRDMDKAVANCLGSSCDASETSIREGLASYIREMDRLHDPSLLGRCKAPD